MKLAVVAFAKVVVPSAKPEEGVLSVKLAELHPQSDLIVSIVVVESSAVEPVDEYV